MARDWSELFITGEADAPGAERGRSSRRAASASAAGCFAACARAWPRPARRSASEIQATLFGVLDEQTWERLEEALIMADVGASTTASVVETLESEAAAGELEGGEALSERLIELLAETARVGDGAHRHLRAKPTVIMAVGVNGTGKTTTIGKLAWHLRERARAQRAAGRRGHLPGGRRRAARGLGRARGLRDRDRRRRAPTPARWPSRRSPRRAARGVDVVIVDTAGRLHTQDDLMGELAKVRRVIARQLDGRAARDAADDRRDHRPERAAPGEAVRRGGRRSAASC